MVRLGMTCITSQTRFVLVDAETTETTVTTAIITVIKTISRKDGTGAGSDIDIPRNHKPHVFIGEIDDGEKAVLIVDTDRVPGAARSKVMTLHVLYWYCMGKTVKFQSNLFNRMGDREICVGRAPIGAKSIIEFVV